MDELLLRESAPEVKLRVIDYGRVIAG